MTVHTRPWSETNFDIVNPPKKINEKTSLCKIESYDGLHAPGNAYVLLH